MKLRGYTISSPLCRNVIGEEIHAREFREINKSNQINPRRRKEIPVAFDVIVTSVANTSFFHPLHFDSAVFVFTNGSRYYNTCRSVSGVGGLFC
ncbi:hypothetical protein CEXT_531381 [Caerostris extrusa]|uniref:Uncharacterized protein n=1 Tax=Caerostris extrusa TaxID=172846 RepID=A0AAV4Y149_CAEEX|nr:hypothetical protein CEXT_531381 [Caerostris extrusa]